MSGLRRTIAHGSGLRIRVEKNAAPASQSGGRPVCVTRRRCRAQDSGCGIAGAAPGVGRRQRQRLLLGQAPDRPARNARGPRAYHRPDRDRIRRGIAAVARTGPARPSRRGMMAPWTHSIRKSLAAAARSPAFRAFDQRGLPYADRYYGGMRQRIDSCGLSGTSGAQHAAFFKPEGQPGTTRNDRADAGSRGFGRQAAGHGGADSGLARRRRCGDAKVQDVFQNRR